MKRTQPGVILRARLAQLHILADDFDDVHLLFHDLSKIVSHGPTPSLADPRGLKTRHNAGAPYLDSEMRASSELDRRQSAEL